MSDQPTAKPAPGKFSQDFFYKTASGLDAHTQVNFDSFEEFKEAVGDILTWLEEQGVQPRPERTYGNGGRSQSNVSNFPAPAGGANCEECGSPIRGFTMNGKSYDPDYLFNSRRKKYGKGLCTDCTKKPPYNAMKNNYNRG